MRTTRHTRVSSLASAAALLLAACSESPTQDKAPSISGDSHNATGGSLAPAANAGAAAAGSGGTTQAATGGTTSTPPITNGNAGSGGANSGSGGVAAIEPELPPYRASIRVAAVPPGDEGTVCVQVRLDNAVPVNIVKLHNTLSNGSHHFIVSKVTDAEGQEEPTAPCTPFRGAVRGAPLTITQKHDDVIEMPEGVAYDLGASQIVHLELHYLNATEHDIDVEAETALYPAPAGTMLHEATVMLIGTGDIAIEPHTVASSGPKFIAMPPEMNGVNYFAITGHTHRFGTRVEVSSAAAAEQAGTLLYSPKPFVWDAPEMKRLEPAVQIPRDGGFTFECEWNNPTDEIITFGESALSEMCFFWAYYYPKKPVTNVLLDGIDIGVFLGAL